MLRCGVQKEQTMKRKEILDKLDRIALFLVEERMRFLPQDHQGQVYWDAYMTAALTIQNAKSQIRGEQS